jgi:hypothetical protein
MGFESLFLISLVITFGAIVFIIYHFKHNISILEKKCDTMFEIMNTLAQDVQKSKMIQQQQQPQFMGGFYNFQTNDCDGSEDVEVTSIENENENIFNRVVVSDDESDDETDEENDTIKVINVVNDAEIDDDNDVEDLEDSPIEEINLDGDNEDIEDIEDIEDDDNVKEEQEEEEKEQDYKKMDISYLRTLVITRGLATDTKKMRKNELIKLLSQE